MKAIIERVWKKRFEVDITGVMPATRASLNGSYLKQSLEETVQETFYWIAKAIDPNLEVTVRSSQKALDQ